MSPKFPTKLLAVTAWAAAGPAFAADPEVCHEIVIGDGGWTDNQAQNGFAAVVLKGLGYEPDFPRLAIGVIHEGMRTDDVDAVLGIWSPNGDPVSQPYLDEGVLVNAGTNLTGAKYALAVPAYEAGLQSFQDITAWREELDGKIYALEPGNDSNVVLTQMQEDGALGLQDFEIVESSEQGMLSEVERAVEEHEPIVFVGWAPHPMNQEFDMEYLSGGDQWFGPNYGSATIWTGLRTGYPETCPNALRLFENLKFTPDLLGSAMQRILDEGLSGEVVAEEALKADPSYLDVWLAGVTTVDGEEGLSAVRQYLGVE